MRIPRSASDAALGVKWWNRSFGARHSPIRLRLELEEVDGGRASIVMEYVYVPYAFEKRKEGEGEGSDLAMFWMDSVRLYERYVVHVARGVVLDGTNKDACVLKIKGADISVRALEKIAYAACKGSAEDAVTEVEMNLGASSADSPWSWKAYALVDRSCRRVYAFKVVMFENVAVEAGKSGGEGEVKEGGEERKAGMGCVGYVLCPDYSPPSSGTTGTAGSGTAAETRPIAYAKERVGLPDIEPSTLPEVVWEDGVDDEVPAPPAPPVVPASLPQVANGDAEGGQVGLEARLASVDRNLERIASAMEKLVEILSKK